MTDKRKLTSKAAKEAFVISGKKFLSRKEIQDHYGVSYDCVTRWLKTRVTPDGNHIRKIVVVVD